MVEGLQCFDCIHAVEGALRDNMRQCSVWPVGAYSLYRHSSKGAGRGNIAAEAHARNAYAPVPRKALRDQFD